MAYKRQTGHRRGGKLSVSIRGIAVAALLASLGIFSLTLQHFQSQVTTAANSNKLEGELQGNTHRAPETLEVDLSNEEKLDRRHQACVRMKSVKDIQTCYPPQFLRPLNASCQDIDDWQDVNRCLMGRRFFTDDENTKEPFVIHVVGERHSGTKYVMRELQQCFLPHAAPFVHKVHRDFIRVKHFFQPALRGPNFRRHLVVVIVRNAVDWVAAMHEKPYHSPSHLAGYTSPSATTKQQQEVIPLTWQEFVSRPWTTHRSQADQDSQKQQQADPKLQLKPICQENFAFHEVVPCQMDNISYNIPPERRRGFSPLYEMRRDGSGKPFDHILQLRSDKIVNFVLQIPMWFELGGFVVVRYEDLMQKGSQFLLEQIADIVGMQELPSECHPGPPQPERLRHRDIPDSLKQWVEDHIDTDREKLVGYG